MAKVGDDSGQNWASWHRDAQVAAAALPSLLVDASHIAQTIASGWHGRRRAGPGERFWQFRRFNESDSRARIDWRRSARDAHLFVREQEWEAAHTVWLWPDRSSSMRFRSGMAAHSKEERALVIALALGELLVRAGERIAVPGLTRPSPDLRAPRRIAEALARQDDTPQGLPATERLAAYCDYVVVSDFLSPPEDTERRIGEIAGAGLRCHLVQVMDPVEETFPFSGRCEFVSAQGAERYVARRAQALRDAYQARLAALRDMLRSLARRSGGTFLVHRTDQPPHQTLLALHAILSAPRDIAAPRQGAGDGPPLPRAPLQEARP